MENVSHERFSSALTAHPNCNHIDSATSDRPTRIGSARLRSDWIQAGQRECLSCTLFMSPLRACLLGAQSPAGEQTNPSCQDKGWLAAFLASQSGSAPAARRAPPAKVDPTAHRATHPDRFNPARFRLTAWLAISASRPDRSNKATHCARCGLERVCYTGAARLASNRSGASELAAAHIKLTKFRLQLYPARHANKPSSIGGRLAPPCSSCAQSAAARASRPQDPRRIGPSSDPTSARTWRAT